MRQETPPIRSRSLGDLLKLLIAAAALAIAGVGTFVLSDKNHVSSKWMFLGWSSVAFLAIIGPDFRAKFKSVTFVFYFGLWMILHGVIFVYFLASFGLFRWLAALPVEFFIFYVVTYLLFRVAPPSNNES